MSLIDWFLSLFRGRRVQPGISLRIKPEESYQLFKSVPVEVAIYDLTGKYRYVNRLYIADDQLRREVIGRDDTFYFEKAGFHPNGIKERRRYFNLALNERRSVRFTEKLFISERNRTIYYKRVFEPLIETNPQGKSVVTGLCLFGNDLTAVILGQQELKYLAFHDRLTGLRNRDGFYEALDQILLDLPRDPGGRINAILFCDLDNFKLVNDSLGHDFGDLVLREVTNRLLNSLRKSDQVFRLGGDEFTIIIRHLKHEYEAGKVAEKIIKNLAQPYILREHQITYLSTSIGIVIIPAQGGDRENLVKRADTAMYAAKNKGKNQYQFFTESMTDDSVQRMKIENSLQTLVKAESFDRECKILYQPIVEFEPTEGFRTIGVEALVRWSSPELGSVMPDTFIPIAEETNLINPMGEWILYQTCREISPLLDRFDSSFYLSINLSAKQLKSMDIVDKIKMIIDAAGVNPHNVQLELTETSYIEDRVEITRNMIKLNSMGIKLAIDDFGIGFASLVYLQRIPATTIKIDRSFVQHISHSEEHRQLVKSIISLGNNLEKEVIAEGVEKPEHLNFLGEQNCRKYQGFLFSKPVQARDVPAFLGKNAAGKFEQLIHLPLTGSKAL